MNDRGQLEEVGLREVLQPCQKSWENIKVKIVAPSVWKSLFLPTTGFYDVMHDEIFIRGRLSEAVNHRTLKHELVHKETFLNHQHFRNLCIHLYWKPALYHKSAPFLLAFGTVLLWWNIVMAVFILPVIIHFFMFYVVLELPANKTGPMTFKDMKELSAKERLRIIFFTIIIASWTIVFAGVVLLRVVWRLSLDIKLSFTLVGLALFAMWIVEIMQNKAIKKLWIVLKTKK